MASAKNLDFEKAIEYMDPMQVTDHLQKILDFLQRNNNEIYFPSISPYVEAFLVNLASDTRNLRSKLFKHDNKNLALDIIEVLEMSRDVFRWTHSYENGNLLVYKKIFSNKMKRKPKPSSIAHRLLQAQTQQSTITNASSLAISQHADTNQPFPVTNNQPDIPVTTTSFKLRFLNKTLRFIKDDTESTLFYNEMPYELAEYIYHLIKYRDKEVGFGYKSLYAPLWEAMEEYGVDYKFEVRIEETSNDAAILILEKVPKSNKSKRDEATRKEEVPESINNSAKRKQDSQKQSEDQPSNRSPSGLPPLELLAHISERFFTEAVVALTEFAGDAGRASLALHQLSEEELAFVRMAKTLAESSKVRETFSPEYRDLLWRLDRSIKGVLRNCKITTTVNLTDRSITLKKMPKFATPLPVTHRSVATRARSKSLASPKTRDRSISKDRLIQFEKGGKLPDTGSESNADNVATGKDSPQDRGRSKDGMSKRTAKLLEDLSTPVESDKGIRMMLLMGWNGGALGARGDGIMEPVMPSIDLPTRGGLGHVPPPKPPKVTPRRPVDFRLMFLHGIYDLLLHEEQLKEIQFNEPLVKKECKFIVSALGALNKRHALSLTEREGELVRRVADELAGRPALELRHELSQDLRTVTLHKLTNQPVKVPKMAAPKQKPKVPKPVKNQSDVITITDDDADVVITELDVTSVMPHVDISEMTVPVNLKAIRKRAVRLIFLTKFAEALHWDFQPRIVFRFDFTMSKKLKIFIPTIVDCLNQGAWHYTLLGWETHIYKDLLDMARGSMLSVEKLPGSKIVLTRTPLVSKDSVNAEPVLRDNNNDDKTDNRNPIVNLNGCTNKVDIDKINSEEENMDMVEHNVESQRLLEAIVTTTSNIQNAISNIELNNNDGIYGLRETSVHAEGITDNSRNNRTAKIIIKDVNRINAEVNSNNLTENEKMKRVEVNIESECDIAEPNVKENNMAIKAEVNNDGITESEAKTKILDTVELSDPDRDIEDLEMTILKADLDCVLKKENDNDCDLEIANPETDLKVDVNKEQDIDYLNAKRSHSSSVCSQEFDSKKVKISIETDEHIVIIIPKNPNEKIREETVIHVQTLIAKEIDKTGGFLPLLECHGVQNGGLIYSCHDEDDVAWLKNVISAADLDVEIIPSNDLYFDKKSRELLFRINSYIPLDTKKIFHKFEMYNVGLNTKHWKVSYKHTETTFVMFIVTVDEKSFKYISDEKFSLYCGIDKAHFSVIF